jgi:hypothetical protein
MYRNTDLCDLIASSENICTCVLLLEQQVPVVGVGTTTRLLSTQGYRRNSLFPESLSMLSCTLMFVGKL